jgi:hypothetical protein
MSATTSTTTNATTGTQKITMNGIPSIPPPTIRPMPLTMPPREDGDEQEGENRSAQGSQKDLDPIAHGRCLLSGRSVIDYPLSPPLRPSQ